MGLTWFERRREAPLCGKALPIVDCSMFACHVHTASTILRSTASGIVKPFSVEAFGDFRIYELLNSCVRWS